MEEEDANVRGTAITLLTSTTPCDIDAEVYWACCAAGCTWVVGLCSAAGPICIVDRNAFETTSLCGHFGASLPAAAAAAAALAAAAAAPAALAAAALAAAAAHNLMRSSLFPPCRRCSPLAC